MIYYVKVRDIALGVQEAIEFQHFLVERLA